jgi:prolyl-tRNA editing enzyme YbaK/EbsC (Cys-tRNA(Pro) deacylase)
MEPPDPEAAALAALALLGLPHERLACDPAAADTAAFCERYGHPPEKVANTILVASKREPRRHAACVVPASKLLDVNHAVRRLLGVPRLSFASADETMRLTGMMVGGVTPFGLPEGLPVFVDADLMEVDYVILGGGGRTSKLKVTPDALRSIPGVQIVAGLAGPRP